ncbi:MAG TPA: small multi-drug export protein [Cytophagales bacterium]|nr:small multi-drug export protein [Cytophagales bacterium]
MLSISPFGEVRAGIPYAILNDVHIIWAFIIGLIANLLIFPLLMWLIDTFSSKLWHHRSYRKGVVSLFKRAKKSVGSNIQKYGFWGLMIFVMIPLPGTGAYTGTIAAYVLKIERKRAFVAISIGVFISCLIMAIGSYFGNIGLELL